MSPDPIDHDACGTVVEVLGRMGDKWTGRVVKTLEHGPMRFAAIRRSLDGISQRMLTLTLRTLERDGFLERTVFPTVPPAVEYRLTDLGRALVARVDSVGAWALANRPRIEAARRRYDAGEDPRPAADVEGPSAATGA